MVVHEEYRCTIVTLLPVESHPDMYTKSTVVLHSPCSLWKATLICTWRVPLYYTHLASCGKPPWYVHEEYRCTALTLLPVEIHPDMYLKSTIVPYSPCFLWKATLICTWRVPLYCTHLASCGKPPWYVHEEYRCTALTLLPVESHPDMYLKSTIVPYSPCSLWKATLICTWRVPLYYTHLASCGKPPWYVHEE